MRHPTTGLSEDDLSRLTGSSSSLTASCGNTSSSTTSSSSPSSTSPTPLSPTSTAENALDSRKEFVDIHHNAHRHGHHHHHHLTDSKSNFEHAHIIGSFKEQTPKRFSSTYLPEIINPLEWQKSRKRKERLDSTSSTQQDRKLQRSNSEELLTPEISDIICSATAKERCVAADVIRRVSSEDFKRTASYATYEQEIENELATEKAAQTQAQAQATAVAAAASASGSGSGSVAVTATATAAANDENDASVANRQGYKQSIFTANGNGDVINDLKYRMRYETSPARSHRHSPVRAYGPSSGHSNGNCRHRDSDDSECEHERRRSSERFCKSRLSQGRKMSCGIARRGGRYASSDKNEDRSYKYDIGENRGFASKRGVAVNTDYNDNNLIDFNQQQNKGSATNSPTPIDLTTANASVAANDVGTINSSNSSNCLMPTKRKTTYNTAITSVQESLPWERSGNNEEPAPILSQRYAYTNHRPAHNIDAAAKLSKLLPYPQQLHKQATTAKMLAADDMDSLDTLDTLRSFSSVDNIRRRDVMKQLLPVANVFRAPEERLRQLKKRKTTLKRKLALLEESLETQLGYRPSQAEKLNDKHIKNILTELNKLRKERQELKGDSIGALKLGGLSGTDAAKKHEKMRLTIIEIEQNLAGKRDDGNRSTKLDELTADQLVQEKTAVQHGLLALESLYGRPMTKEERDIVRPLYERYRQLKRMVSRIVTSSGNAACVSDLPTIHENVAMVFETSSLQYSTNTSSDTSNSPSETGGTSGCALSSEESSTLNNEVTNKMSTEIQPLIADVAVAASPIYENLNELSLDRLWEELEREQGGKEQLKRIIREYESTFEEQNGRKMLKQDRKSLEETYAQYKERKAKVRLLQALIKKKRRN